MKKINGYSQLCKYTREISGKIKWDESSVEYRVPDAALNINGIENGLAVKFPESNFGSCPQAKGQKLIL